MSNINYTNHITRINSRYNPDNNRIVENRTFSATSDDPIEAAKYVHMAMREVDETYTRITRDAGDAVKKILSAKLSDVDFEYQGSVMTDTHIKGYSDIDLLTICNRFNHTEISKVREALNNSWHYNISQLDNLKNYDNSFYPYQGNARADLRKLRLDNESLLNSTYTICDTTKPKAIKITNQHLHRDVDIVTSTWYDSLEYVLSGNDQKHRGIKIYQKDTDSETEPDYPFLGISMINERSSLTNGRLKRMIRFLKNVRSDADAEIKLTSFDINAICYNVPPKEYLLMDYKQLVFLLWNKMYHLCNNEKIDDLKSVVGTEYVFRNKPEKVGALRLLENEVWEIYNEIK